MLTAAQIEEIECAMIADHQKDLEALARLKRFLPTNGKPAAINTAPATTPTPTPPPSFSLPQTPAVPVILLEPPEDAKSLRARVADSMSAEPSVAWSAPSMVGHLRASGVSLRNSNPITGIQLIMAHWMRRGKVRLVRKGSGRIPNLYQWVAGESKEEGM